jgi:hypothetical protein
MTMNAICYQEALEDHLLMFMGIHGCTHFLHDGAPCHASKCIKDFLAEQPFQVIEWPGNSPDLNPIENCWNQLKNLLKKKDISSVPKLTADIRLWTVDRGAQARVREEFERFDAKELEIVIDAKGDMTKY